MTKNLHINRLTVFLAVLAALALVLTGLIGSSVPAHAATVTAKKQTVVSLTFDDGDADQMQAVPVMQQYGLTGTFYIITGYLGASGYMQQSDLQTIAAAGNEIGAHTVTHQDMAQLSQAEDTRQACQSRATLTSWGYTVRSFAYPFASANARAKAAVQSCGFTSARGLGDVKTPYDCADCVLAETLPPRQPMYTRAPTEVDHTWSLADIQSEVTQAVDSGKGGWVQLTFHHLSDDASLDPTTSPALFAQFAQWLAAYTADPTNNATVKTVGDAVGAPAKPVVQAPTPAPAGPGVNGIVNPSFETQATDIAGNVGPKCWQRGGYGTNTPTFSVTTPGRVGTATKAAALTMSGYSDGDAKWLPTFDLGECAPSVATGHTYSLREWYKSDSPTQFAVYLRDTNGVWHYWTSSPWFAANATYTQAVWTSDAIPAGYNGISFGLNLFQNGSLTTDDAALYDSVGAPDPAKTTTSTTPTGATTTTTSASALRTLIAPFLKALQVRKQAAVGAEDPSGTVSDLAH